jgi:hypothetical protein
LGVSVCPPSVVSRIAPVDCSTYPVLALRNENEAIVLAHLFSDSSTGSR